MVAQQRVVEVFGKRIRNIFLKIEISLSLTKKKDCTKISAIR